MDDRPASAPPPAPDEPILRTGTWQPNPRARHARSAPDAGDDPLRLAPDELPWGVPARAASPDGELPPPTVLAARRGPWRVVVVVAVVAVSVVLGLVLAVVR